MTTADTRMTSAARADENLRSAAKGWALACNAGEAWEERGLVVASSGVDMRSFNAAFITTPEGIRQLDNLRTYFERRAVKYRVRVLDGIAIDEQTLAEDGLERHGGIPSLVLAPIPHADDKPALKIQPIIDAQTLRHHIQVVAAGFEWEPDVLARVFADRLLDSPAWRGFVGYLDGQPVASSQLYLTDGIAGIYYVATLPDQRRRGFGEAMTSHAMREGVAAGCDISSLQASPMGLPIYTRMGFQQVGYYRTYVPKEA